jgi:hypothetical protein
MIRSSTSAQLAPENAHFCLRKVRSRPSTRPAFAISDHGDSPQCARLTRERSCGSYTRFGRPLTKAPQGLESDKLLFVFEVQLPTSRGQLFLSACLIASRSDEENDLHHHGQPVLDSRELASLTSWLGKRFPFLFAGLCPLGRP